MWNVDELRCAPESARQTEFAFGQQTTALRCARSTRGESRRREENQESRRPVATKHVWYPPQIRIHHTWRKGKFPANSGTEEGPVDAMIYAYFRMLLIRLCERT